MEGVIVSEKPSGVRSSDIRTSNTRDKLYDARRSSAYTSLSLTHESRLRRITTGKPNEEALYQNGRIDRSKITQGSQENTRSGNLPQEITKKESYYSPTPGCLEHEQPNGLFNRSHGGDHANNSPVVRNSAKNSFMSTVSLPLSLETQNEVQPPVKTDPSQDRNGKKSVDFGKFIQVPYEDENTQMKKNLGKASMDTLNKDTTKTPIFIESFRDSTLRSFPVSNEENQSFSMLTFNAGLLEVRMLGLQMYQNPGYTDKRLRCIPSEIRKADADVVAFQEVYSDKHANYIIKELRDLYPYHARNDSPPVSEAYEKLYEKRGRNRKRGIGVFHSGLLFLSKFPILCAIFHPWDVVTYLEALLGNKGYLEIFATIPTIGKVAFYNMHMASASVNPESSYIEKVRNEEIRQLLRTAERACKLGFAPIIIGDLNAAPNNCTSNYMSFLHGGWADSYVLSRQKVRQRKWYGLKSYKMGKDSIPLLNSTSAVDYITVENVFGSNKTQKPQLDKVTVMSNINRSKSGDNMKSHSHLLHEHSRWTRFMDYVSMVKPDRRRRTDPIWRSVRAYYPAGRSMNLRVIHCHPLTKNAPKKNKILTRLNKLVMKNKLRVKIKAPCLEDENKSHTRTLREKCSALFRRSRGRNSSNLEQVPKLAVITSARSRVTIDNTKVYFLVKNPQMQLKKPQVKRFHWWNRRRNFMDVTWDPKNPLNIHGPHAGCSGLRCDYIFLPPPHIAGILQEFAPSAGEILFREPIVMIDKVGSAYNCLCSAFTSMKKVMLVTLSDHYGLKITLSRKTAQRDRVYMSTLRSFRSM